MKVIKIIFREYSKISTGLLKSYVQGQYSNTKTREYFYFIDHQGMLFLDDARMKNFTSCFKEKKFLQFFFKRLRFNTTESYVDFPFLSICGRERNYVRCDDLPFVYTHVIERNNENGTEFHLSYGHAGDMLTVKFEPAKIFMSLENGRVYHPAPEYVGGIGLIQTKLAMEFSKKFVFDDNKVESPTHFIWRDITYELDNNWYIHNSYNKNNWLSILTASVNCSRSTTMIKHINITTALFAVILSFLYDFIK